MKIGIITQPLESNYGGIVQNFALQSVVRKLGHSPITINCYPRSYVKLLRYNLKSAFYFFMSVKRRPFKWNRRPHPEMESFLKYIQRTGYCTKIKSSVIDDYGLSAIVVGSDQVWRPDYVDNIYDMFLGFAYRRTIIRVAYAASFGVAELNFTKKQTGKCRRLLSRFDGISVREETGRNLCVKYFDHDAQVVLDPTLLLEKENYNVIIKDVPKSCDGFILAYILDATQEKRLYVEALSSQLGLDVRFVTAHENVTVSVEEWLALFRDAKYVVTDSFHGTVFSIIYQKNFSTMANSERGIDRFVTLLAGLGLQYRMNISVDSVMECGINWHDVEKKLSEKKIESLNFLRKSLNPKQEIRGAHVK